VPNVEARFALTGSGTTAGVTVTQAAPTDIADQYLVTGIQCVGDAAAIVTVESPAGTIVWRKQYAAAFTMSEVFGAVEAGALPAVNGQAVLVKINASTAFCHANMQLVRI
jgi:hypothetical protein